MNRMNRCRPTNEWRMQLRNLPLPVLDWRKGNQGGAHRIGSKTNIQSCSVDTTLRIFEIEIATIEEQEQDALQDRILQEHLRKK